MSDNDSINEGLNEEHSNSGQLMERQQYPIGKFQRPEPIDRKSIDQWIRSLEQLPDKLEELLINLDEEDWELQYRPGSWTIRQIVHHIADSHVNGYIRVKWALTEDLPVIKSYDENAWSRLADVEQTNWRVSVNLLRAIHQRWVVLIKNLNSAEMKRKFYHPENKVEVSILEQIGLYAWHGEHHYSHIILALQKN